MVVLKVCTLTVTMVHVTWQVHQPRWPEVYVCPTTQRGEWKVIAYQESSRAGTVLPNTYKLCEWRLGHRLFITSKMPFLREIAPFHQWYVHTFPQNEATYETNFVGTFQHISTQGNSITSGILRNFPPQDNRKHWSRISDLILNIPSIGLILGHAGNFVPPWKSVIIEKLLQSLKGSVLFFGMDGLSWSWRNEKHVKIRIMLFS